MPEPTRVLIADDHPVLRSGLRQLIGREPDLQVIGEAEDAAGALREAETHRPDLIVVDLSLRHSHGLELVGQIAARFPGTRILVFSMHDERLFAERALRAGAMGYVNKQEPPEVLLTAIRRVMEGGVYLSERVADQLLGTLVGTRLRTGQAAPRQLSDRELEVLEALGQGMTTREIASYLKLSPKTVEAHRQHLKAKLHLKSSGELTRYAVALALEQVPPHSA